MITTIGTHDGRFHSDDVFSVALLKKLYPMAKVVRSRNLEVLATCDIVLDVGGEYDFAKSRFDHHQPGGAGERDNGIPYSAFGLIWKQYGLEYCGGDKETWKRIDESFVSSFDAFDNGKKTYEMVTENAHIVELQDLFDDLLNPNLSEPAELSDFDTRFEEALQFAGRILERAVGRTKAGVESEVYFEDTWHKSPDKRYVVLDKFATAGDASVRMPGLLYVVYQAPNKDWCIRAIPKERGSYEPKQPLPEAWAGLRDQELSDLIGVEGAVFCHNNRHLCGAHTKEACLKMLTLALA